MLGIWGCSSLARPPMSGVVRLATARHFHKSLRPLARSPGVRQTLNVTLPMHPFRRIEVRLNSTQVPTPKTPPTEKRSLLARFLRKPSASKGAPNTSSLRKILVLAKPEWKPLTLAIGLLLGSSAVSMSVPFTIGKLIDFFTIENPVSIVVYALPTPFSYRCSIYRSDCLPGKLRPDFYCYSPSEQLQMRDVRCL